MDCEQVLDLGVAAHRHHQAVLGFDRKHHQTGSPSRNLDSRQYCCVGIRAIAKNLDGLGLSDSRHNCRHRSNRFCASNAPKDPVFTDHVFGDFAAEDVRTELDMPGKETFAGISVG